MWSNTTTQVRSHRKGSFRNYLKNMSRQKKQREKQFVKVWHDATGSTALRNLRNPLQAHAVDYDKAVGDEEEDDEERMKRMMSEIDNI